MLLARESFFQLTIPVPIISCVQQKFIITGLDLSQHLVVETAGFSGVGCARKKPDYNHDSRIYFVCSIDLDKLDSNQYILDLFQYTYIRFMFAWCKTNRC